MARKFQFKRGLKAQLPTLAAGEPGWVTDEGKLYIGTGGGNIPVARGDHTHTPAEVGILIFSGLSVTVASWASNSTYASQGYNWRAAVACAGVTASYRPDVAFGVADSVSGNFALVADSYAGGVYIYCKTKPTATMTIPSIVAVKGA